MKKLDKSAFTVEQMIGGQYRITNGNLVVWGGDSACEDHYSEELANDIYARWDGSVTCDSEDCADDELYINTSDLAI